MGEPRRTCRLRAGRRPVVVVQADGFNRSRLRTVVVVALTSNLHLLDAPGNLLVPARTAGLARDLVANVTQVATLDRDYQVELAGALPHATLDMLSRGLRLALGL